MNVKARKYLSLFLSLVLLVQLCVFVMPAQDAHAASSTVYYFSTSGKDTNDGLSDTSPKQTLAEAARLMAPGVTVKFKRGDAWYGQASLQIRNKAGTAAAPIVVDSYGTGAKPIIAGMDLYDSSANWTSAGSNIWKVPVNSGGVRRVFVNGGSKAFASSVNGVNNEYCYYDSSYIYVYSTSKPTYVEAIRDTSCDSALVVNSCSYVTVQNLEFRGGNTYAVVSLSGWSDHVTFSYLNIKEASTRWPGMTSPSDFGYGIYVVVDENTNLLHNFTVIDHCDITKTWSKAENDPTYGISNGGDGIYLVKAVQHAWIHDNIIHDIGHVGINLSGNSATNLGVNYNVIENNIVFNTTNYYIHGVGVQGGEGLCHDNIVRRNYFYDTTVSSHATGHNNYVYSNIWYNTVRSQRIGSDQGNSLDIGPFTENGVPYAAHDTIIANNDFVGCDMGALYIESGDYGPTPVGKGFLIANNIVTSWNNGFAAFKENYTAVGAVTYKNNGIFNGTNHDMLWGSGRYYTVAAAQSSADYTASGNVDGKPSFINVAQVCAPTTYDDFSGLDVKFGLKSDSPYKAAGTPVTALVNALNSIPSADRIPGVAYTFTDFFGNAWNSTTPSIGAVQYQTNTLTDNLNYSALQAKIDQMAAVNTSNYSQSQLNDYLLRIAYAKIVTTGVASQQDINNALAVLNGDVNIGDITAPAQGTLAVVAATTNQPGLDPSRGPGKAIDGDIQTSWFSTNYTNGTTPATSASDSNTFFWLMLDLGAVKWVDHIDISTVAPSGNAGYKIQTLLSMDGNFDYAKTQDPNVYDLITYSQDYTTIPNIEPQMARYILLVGKGNTGATGIYTTISEVKVWGQTIEQGTLSVASATTNQPGLDPSRGPEKAIDGDIQTSWFSTNYVNGTTPATSAADSNTFYWLKLDLGSVKWVDHIGISTVAPNGSAGYKIQTLLSTDGNFDYAKTQDPAAYDLITYSQNYTTIPNIEPQMARYILFVGKGNTGATQIYTTISEAKVWGLTVNYLQNPGLETGSVSPWTDDGNAGPTISTDAHSGQYALYTARAHDYNGPTQNVTNIFNKYGEGTYYAEAWVKLPSGQANDTLCFTVDSTTANGIRSYDDFANKAISASNGWVQFSGEKEVLKKGGQAGTYSIVNFKLDGNGTSSVLTDDFALNRVPPSFTSVTSSGGTTFEVGAVSGNLTINGSSFSPGIAKVYLVPQSGTDILLTGGKAADTTRQIVIPLNTSLPVGVYKIKVAVSDISTVYSSMTITVTPKVNLLANPGLETGSVSPWTDDGNAGPTISSDAHSGQYALYTARAHDYNGPTQNVTDIFNKYGEGTYYAEAWAKLPAGQANDTLCFTVDSTTTNGIRSYDDFAGKAISSSNGWVQLSGQKEVLKKSGQTGAYSLVNFKLDGNGASAVLADDFVLRRVAPSFTTVTSSGGTSFKQGSVSGTLTINGSSFSPGIAKVYLVPQSGAEIQLTGTKTVDTTSQIIIPLNVNLPAGVYMVKVAVADVSSIYQSLTITVS